MAGRRRQHRRSPHRGLLLLLLLLTVVGLGATTMTSYAVSSVSVGVPPGPPGGEDPPGQPPGPPENPPGQPPGPPGGGDNPPDRPPCWPNCDERPPCWPNCDERPPCWPNCDERPPCWPNCDRDRDFRRPFVLEEFPRDGTFGVSRFTDVEVVFSESVRGVDEDTFRLFSADAGRSVLARVFRTGSSRRWVLDPRGPLARSTRYVAVLRGGSFGIRDFAGNGLSSTDWSFRTGGFRR